MQDAAATIARQLAQDENATRIYKFLTYVNEGAWVGDIASPNEAMIYRVLDEIFEQFPDLTFLRSHLHISVNTLSKPAEYSQIADTILEAIFLVRGGEDPTTMFLGVVPPTNPQVKPQTTLYTTISAQLVLLPNQIRLKKLAFCAAKSIWEEDLAKLGAMSWIDLTNMMHQRHATRQDLKKGLQQVVSRLSKPIEYSLLAETLIDHLQALYHVAIVETPPIAAELNLTPSFTPNLNSSEAESLANFDEVGRDNHVPRPHDVIPPSSWGDDTGSRMVEAIDSAVFDLHFDIVKLANPLRLKHLLLILVNSIEPENAIEGMTLRQQATMPLLATAFRLHRKPEILAIKLREIARKLPDSDEYETTIDAIMRAFKARSASISEVGTASKRMPSDESVVATGIRA
ncbi:MAG: hypothetical protein NT070_04585 [Cyanobacteria bacterium]|nr:hypothetical protein [Cyanobacteriota bacterium]